ncbi:MAG: hypothetical protein IJM35_04800 [Bacteroidales bacterium]|nr:hypothetical protein [Bacteroidales bacterium]
MKRFLGLFFILCVVAGCSKSDSSIHRKMVAAAYYYQDAEAGRHFTFYLVEKKADLVQSPDDPNAMEVTKYVCLEFYSGAETPQGTYLLTDSFIDTKMDVGEAIAFDNCYLKGQQGYIPNGTVEIGDNTIAIHGTMKNGREYTLSYSGPFQQTGNITTFL